MASELAETTTAVVTVEEEAEITTTETSDPDTAIKTERECRVCGQGEEKGRRLCCFLATEEAPDELYLHVFCGKTAAILPHVNRPDLEILTKAGIKNKHGTGVSVTMALQRCRSAKVDDASGREQEYYLSKEFERIYLAITKAAQQVVEDEPQPPANPFEELDGEIIPNPMDTHFTALSSTSSVTPDQQQPLLSADTTTYEHLAAEAATQYTDPQIGNAEPPNKKQRTHKSPYDIEMERLQSVCDQCNGVGYSLVRGVARSPSSDEGDEDDDNFDPTKCSQAQVDHVRVIVITKDRQERMDQMGRLVLGKQYGEQLLHFNTSFSYDVLNAWNEFTVRFHDAKDNQEKFDLLLGFTHTIKEHDVWMHDHEAGWGGDDMVKQLGQSWTLVLPKTDQELGIDSEYTRPGIVALLEQFKEAVESAQGASAPMQFNFETR